MTTQPLPKKKKFGWLKWVLGVPVGLLLLVILIGIFGPEPEKKTEKETAISVNQPVEEKKVEYSITSKNEYPSNNKANVSVQLESPVNEEELKAIGEEIKEGLDSSFERVYIFYYLPGFLPSSAYAISHFEGGNLTTANIIGASKGQIEELKARPAPEGKIIGDWIEPALIGQRITIYQKGGQFYMKQIFKDGSGGDTPEKLIRTESGKIIRFSYPKAGGDYFEIQPDNTLRIFNKNGKQFASGNKI